MRPVYSPVSCKHKAHRLSGAMVSVLTIGPKVRSFTPSRGDEFLRRAKIYNTPFGGDVRHEAPCRNITCKKITCKYEQKYFARLNAHSFPYSSYLLPDVVGRTARELWLSSQEFSFSRQQSSTVLRAHISPRGLTIRPLVAAFQRHSVAPSTSSSSFNTSAFSSQSL
jgi:hypothetical protein